MQLDYTMFLEQGKEEKDKVLTELKERLDRMTPWNMMEKQATMMEQMTNILKQKPLGLFVR